MVRKHGNQIQSWVSCLPDSGRHETNFGFMFAYGLLSTKWCHFLWGASGVIKFLFCLRNLLFFGCDLESNALAGIEIYENVNFLMFVYGSGY